MNGENPNLGFSPFFLEFLKGFSLKGLRYGGYNGLIKGKIL